MASKVYEYSGQRFLFAEQVIEPGEGLTAAYETLETQIKEVLAERKIQPTPWYFKRSAYKHGGITHAQVVYTLVQHQRAEA